MEQSGGESASAIEATGSMSERSTTDLGSDRDYIMSKVRGRLYVPEPSVIRIGRFVVLEQIGRGGMGTVHAAYDEQLDRKVAIKVMREDELPTEELRLRFLREAQALARLSHPNVVTVHEVGQGEDDVYLAMEFVRGQSLTAWLREKPAWPDVLDAFVKAGRGLMAAHDAGLVHRDFKLDNVIRGEGGVVKVLDFGLARVMEAESIEASTTPDSDTASGALTRSSLLTVSGTVMGTPAYMSPEQHRGEEADAQSDQYSFCVAAWEALVGERPFRGLDWEALGRAKHAGSPSWPSSAPPVPRRIVQALRRGLSVDPRDRWPSMRPLLEVLAWSPARRRNRWVLGLAGAGALGLGGVALHAWANARAERCSGAAEQLAGVWDEPRRAEVKAALLGTHRSYATPTWTHTRQQLDAYADQWVAMHTEACEATAVRGEQSPRVLDLRMRCLHRAAEEMRATADALANADARVLQRTHELTAGLPLLSRCADAEALTAEVEPPPPGEAEAVAAVREELARARSLNRAGRYEAALASAEAAEERLVGVEYGPVRTELALVRGSVLQHLGNYDASEAALIEAQELAAQHSQRDALRAATTSLLALVGHQQKRIDEALRYRPLAAGLTADPLEKAKLQSKIGLVLYERGDYPAAEAKQRAALSLMEQALDPEDLHTALVRSSLGAVLMAQGKRKEAEVLLRATLSAMEKALGATHPRLMKPRNNLGNALAQQGKLEEAEAMFREVLSSYQDVLGPEHPDLTMSRVHLANVLTKRGMLQESEEEYRAALPILENALGPDHPSIAIAQLNLGATLRRRGKLKEAAAELGSAVARLEQRLGPEHLHVVSARTNLANVFAIQGRTKEAEAELRRTVSTLEESQGPDHPMLAIARNNLAELLLKIDQVDEARPLAEQAWARQQRDDIVVGHRADSAFTLARALWRAQSPYRDRERARRLAEDALHSCPEGDEDIERIERWLGEHPLP